MWMPTVTNSRRRPLTFQSKEDRSRPIKHGHISRPVRFTLWKVLCVGRFWWGLCHIKVLGFGALQPRWTAFSGAGRSARSELVRQKIAANNFPESGHMITALDSVNVTQNTDGVSESSPVISVESERPRTPAPSSSSSSFIPREEVEYLQQTVDIVSFIESYELAAFKSSGSGRAVCLCPFHDDRNPSLSIDGSRGIFKCFSCGTGGDIYAFVREYAKLHGETMSFAQAVRLVKERSLNGSEMPLRAPYAVGPMRSTFSSTNPSLSATPQNKMEAEHKKRRVILANLAAAAFYENCLVSQETAGFARAHLRQRNMSPQTVRAFAIGYAPDCYFGNITYRQWGDGSLVNHLKKKGFTPMEILDAGLAIQTKQKESKRQSKPVDNTNQSDKAGMSDMAKPLDHTSLMDRFRGRLVIPIFDANGTQVLGFGGRILVDSTNDETDSGKGNYTQPKYLNSPESVVFQKKTILFGQHMAKKAIRFWNIDQETPRAVVLVEGYMDAIALWQGGVREAVACMGTGLTIEQVTAAAKLAGSKNGRVVLCLDNDQAGISAVERICSRGILATVQEAFPVEFRIARCTAGVKDPADYMELHKEEDALDEKFRLEVVQESVEWSEWYQTYLMNRYNRTAPRQAHDGFDSVLDRLASFLAMCKDTSEREKRSRDIVNRLVKEMSEETSQLKTSESVVIQLESDLQKRVRIMSKGNRPRVYTESESAGDRRSDNVSKLLSRMAPSNQENAREYVNTARRENFSPPDEDVEIGNLALSRKFRVRNRIDTEEPSLTPHFSGFQFEGRHDALWFGDIGAKSKRGKTSGRKTRDAGDDEDADPVYFNSNDYHGRQFITEDAISAGYRNEAVPRNPELLTLGINSMILPKYEQILLSAEDVLLRSLLLFPSSRESLRKVIDMGQSSWSGIQIEWTSPNKAWLFSRILENCDDVVSFGSSNLHALQEYLSTQADVLPGALSRPSQNPPTDDDDDDETEEHPIREQAGGRLNLYDAPSYDIPLGAEPTRNGETLPSSNMTKLLIEGGEASPGTLDHLFVEKLYEIEELSITAENAELVVQEAYYTMLWASANKCLSHKQAQMMNIEALLRQSNSTASKDGFLDDNSTRMLLPPSIDSVDVVELLQSYDDVQTDLQSSLERASLLGATVRDMSSKLLNKIVSSGFSHRSATNRDYGNLDGRLRQHMSKLDELSVPEDVIDDHGIRDDGEESYEDMLERSQVEWGDLYDDDRMWSAGDIARPRLLADTESLGYTEDAIGGEEEPINDFSERIHDDWGWVKESGSDDSEAIVEMSNPYTFDESDWDDFISNPDDQSEDGCENLTQPTLVPGARNYPSSKVIGDGVKIGTTYEG